jgi:hypothetical protein
VTSVTVNTYTHSVTYVADNILKSLKDIIRETGLDPSAFVGNWELNRRGVAGWLESGHLSKVVLEIFDPTTGTLLVRWDIDITYGYSGDGGFFTDTDQLKYHIRKAGLAPSQARYRLILMHQPGAPDIAGWSDATVRSTTGFVRQNLGATIEHSGLGANASYWRKS